MRCSILVLTVLLSIGCSTSKPRQDDAEVITRTGVIVVKDDTSQNAVEGESTGSSRSSVYGSVSTGSSGSGVSIGLGVLLGSLSSGGSGKDPVRYDIETLAGETVTVYYESHDFEVGDCVEVTSHPDEEKFPPVMKRSKGACE
jgi:hypothetical protein